MFEDFEDPLARLEKVETVLARSVDILQQSVEQGNNSAWLVAEMNRHVADLTTGLNYLTDIVAGLKQRIEELENKIIDH